MADKPKQVFFFFPAGLEWEDVSLGCFGRHHEALLCALSEGNAGSLLGV